MTCSRKRHSRQAFTLLELMIVLVILVFLVAMVGPRLLGSKKKADINLAKTQIGILESALKMYAVDLPTFPLTEDGLQALVESPSDERAAKKWDGPYLEDGLPFDPWDNPYEYEYPPSRNSRDFPDIWSLGPDGEADTDDDIGNWRSGGGGEGATGEDTGEDMGNEGRTKEPRERAPAREPSGGGGGGGQGNSGGGKAN